MREPVYNQTEEKSLADEYEYVMHGRVFKVTSKGDRSTVYASFGGLLMGLTTEPRYLNGFEMDMPVYLLMRKA
jgi:DNA-directed RNA polymerase I, II, and III subunit RPABC3